MERERERERALRGIFLGATSILPGFYSTIPTIRSNSKKKTVRVHGDRPVFCRAISQQSVLFAQTPATVRKKAVL